MAVGGTALPVVVHVTQPVMEVVLADAIIFARENHFKNRVHL